MILAALILGVMGYSAICAICYFALDTINEDPDKTTDVDEVTRGWASAFWLFAFIPVYLAAWGDVNRTRKKRERKERDELLKKEGLL